MSFMSGYSDVIGFIVDTEIGSSYPCFLLEKAAE